MIERNRPTRRRKLEVESLESMALTSSLVAPVAPHVGPVAAAMSTTLAPNALNLTARGYYSFSRSNPDTGFIYSLFATTRAAGLGSISVSGNIRTPGFIASGQANGTLKVLVPGGSLTLSVVGPTQPGFSHLPTTLSFTVTSATGTLASISGAGTLTLGLRTAFSLPGPVSVGFVTMTFREPKPVA
jgi:hypothetical protein